MTNKNIIKETIVDTTKQIATEAYNDTIHPLAKNAGGVLGTIAGFFNHVVVYPLKKLNTIYEQKAIAFEKEMAIKYGNIPEENRVEPQLNIVGPAMESLKYNIMEAEIAEMYSNLLVSDLDKETQPLCSPAFIKIIEQMSPVDAKVYKNIVDYTKLTSALPICSISFVKKSDATKMYNVTTPTYLSVNLDCEPDDFNYSASLIQLNRLGLISISFTKWLKNNDEYYSILQKETIQGTLAELQAETSGDVDVKITSKGVIQINDFSKSFAKICFRQY